jgi:hypothetical protein
MIDGQTLSIGEMYNIWRRCHACAILVEAEKEAEGGKVELSRATENDVVRFPDK